MKSVKTLITVSIAFGAHRLKNQITQKIKLRKIICHQFNNFSLKIYIQGHNMSHNINLILV